MTVAEFSNEFDLLYNNITSNQAPGLDEYEKSVFLTKAQDEIVKSYFDPRSNKVLEGFDGNEKRQIDFSMLMRVVTETALTTSHTAIHNCSNSKFYAIPADILLYINEFVYVSGGRTTMLSVVPISFTEYSRLMSKPFKRPLKNLAWRLMTTGAGILYTMTDYAGLASNLHAIVSTINTNTAFININGRTVDFYNPSSTDYYLRVDGSNYMKSDGSLTTVGSEALVFTPSLASGMTTAYINKTISSSTSAVEIIPGPSDTLGNYVIRYVARPTPIILTNLSYEGVSIGGQTSVMNCLLDPILHLEILQRAVELAKAAYLGDLSSTTSIGNYSSTLIGVLPLTKSKE